MSHTEVVQIRTTCRSELVDVTDRVEAAAASLGVESGVVMVYSPHTTAAITINEGADPDVCTDVVAYLDGLVPRSSAFRHAEGNSDAHIKTMFVGPSELVAVEGGRLTLGTWQRVFFCEFDGPRSRRFTVTVLK